MPTRSVPVVGSMIIMMMSMFSFAIAEERVTSTGIEVSYGFEASNNATILNGSGILSEIEHFVPLDPRDCALVTPAGYENRTDIAFVWLSPSVASNSTFVNFFQSRVGKLLPALGAKFGVASFFEFTYTTPSDTPSPYRGGGDDDDEDDPNEKKKKKAEVLGIVFSLIAVVCLGLFIRWCIRRRAAAKQLDLGPYDHYRAMQAQQNPGKGDGGGGIVYQPGAATSGADQTQGQGMRREGNPIRYSTTGPDLVSQAQQMGYIPQQQPMPPSHHHHHQHQSQQMMPMGTYPQHQQHHGGPPVAGGYYPQQQQQPPQQRY